MKSKTILDTLAKTPRRWKDNPKDKSESMNSKQVDYYHKKYNSFYFSKEWRQLRNQKWQDCNGLCEICKSKGIIRKADEVHHIIPIDQDWDKRLDYSNLICLCKDCHNLQHENRMSPLEKFEIEWQKMRNE